MKINLGPFTTIEKHTGPVWREAFTFQEADDLAEAMERLAPDHIRTELRPAWNRLTDMLHALTNDSSACIVTAGNDEDN